MLLYELDFPLLHKVGPNCCEVEVVTADEAMVTLWDKTQIISLFLR